MLALYLNITRPGHIRLRFVVEAMVGGVEIREIVDTNEQWNGQECAQDETNDSFEPEIHLRELLAHPRREWKPKFKLKRYPPLY